VDVGGTQKKLSQWAEQDKEHRFYDLHHLLHHEDWLYAAYKHVGRVLDLDFHCPPCHAEALFSGGLSWYACQFPVPTVRASRW
jgi:hypothetical protein